MQRTYLDHNATAPVRAEAATRLVEVLGAPVNPSSIHQEGRAGRVYVDHARHAVAALVGADARAVVFTAGGTEADALALTPEIDLAGKRVVCDVLLVSAVEHSAVLRGHRFPADRVEIIPVDPRGRVDVDTLDTILAAHAAEGRRALVSVMLANNETGVIQPIAEIARRAKAFGAVVHTDAVQAAGRIPVDIRALGVDLLSLSAHKIGGAPGAGALVAAHIDTRVAFPVFAGAQEQGRRGGTENVPAVAAFGVAALAAAATLESETRRLSDLRERLESALRSEFPELVLFGGDVERLPNTSNIAVPGVAAETLVIALDLAGVAVSAGAACSSGKVGPSHVLAAMGVPDRIARGAVRVSLGWSSDEDDIERATAAFRRVLPGLLRRSRVAA